MKLYDRHKPSTMKKIFSLRGLSNRNHIVRKRKRKIALENITALDLLPSLKELIPYIQSRDI